MLITVFNRDLNQRLDGLSVSSELRKQIDSQRSKLAAIQTIKIPMLARRLPNLSWPDIERCCGSQSGLSVASSLSAVLLIKLKALAQFGFNSMAEARAGSPTAGRKARHEEYQVCGLFSHQGCTIHGGRRHAVDIQEQLVCLPSSAQVAAKSIPWHAFLGIELPLDLQHALEHGFTATMCQTSFTRFNNLERLRMMRQNSCCVGLR